MYPLQKPTFGSGMPAVDPASLGIGLPQIQPPALPSAAFNMAHTAKPQLPSLGIPNVGMPQQMQMDAANFAPSQALTSFTDPAAAPAPPKVEGPDLGWGGMKFGEKAGMFTDLAKTGIGLYEGNANRKISNRAMDMQDKQYNINLAMTKATMAADLDRRYSTALNPERLGASKEAYMQKYGLDPSEGSKAKKAFSYA